MGVEGSLHPSRRETGVLRQHSRTVAAAATAAEEARSDMTLCTGVFSSIDASFV